MLNTFKLAFYDKVRKIKPKKDKTVSMFCLNFEFVFCVFNMDFKWHDYRNGWNQSI